MNFSFEDMTTPEYDVYRKLRTPASQNEFYSRLRSLRDKLPSLLIYPEQFLGSIGKPLHLQTFTVRMSLAASKKIFALNNISIRVLGIVYTDDVALFPEYMDDCDDVIHRSTITSDDSYKFDIHGDIIGYQEDDDQRHTGYFPITHYDNHYITPTYRLNVAFGDEDDSIHFGNNTLTILKESGFPLTSESSR